MFIFINNQDTFPVMRIFITGLDNFRLHSAKLGDEPYHCPYNELIRRLKVHGELQSPDINNLI